jgi:hypothetical protein
LFVFSSDTIEARGYFVSKQRSAGNEQRRWHGTSRQCTLGDNGNTQLCSVSDCSLCGIIRTSFVLNYCKRNTGWARFGNGIYLSSTSSKYVHCKANYIICPHHGSRSNDYTKNSGPKSRWKALLLATVVVGEGCKMKKDNMTLTGPPPGFDSVSFHGSHIFRRLDIFFFFR